MPFFWEKFKEIGGLPFILRRICQVKSRRRKNNWGPFPGGVKPTGFWKKDKFKNIFLENLKKKRFPRPPRNRKKFFEKKKKHKAKPRNFCHILIEKLNLKKKNCLFSKKNPLRIFNRVLEKVLYFPPNKWKIKAPPLIWPQKNWNFFLPPLSPFFKIS